MQAEAFPGYEGPVELVETHVSWLFFAGERVYKVKRPVDLGFVDARTLEQRRFLCDEEVRLNQELAPGIYLGVVPIVREGSGALRVGGSAESEALEWAVEMRRLPSECMLAELLEEGAVDNALFDRIAQRLVGFHERAPAGAEVRSYATPEALGEMVDENLRGARQAGRGILSPIQAAFLERWSRSFFSQERELLERRLHGGRIREGHGDLHAENLCVVGERVIAYDRLEFSRRLRCGDVALDLAFLAMDLDWRGYPAFSHYLVRSYAERTGDTELPALMDIYKSYRAVVRGKVAAIGAGSVTRVGSRARSLAARRVAHGYFQLAVGYGLPPILVLLSGLPAAGKSRFAEALVRPLRAVRLSSDVRRKVAAGLSPKGPSGEEELGAGLYHPDRRAQVYDLLLADTREHLRHGRSVVVDATFGRADERARFVAAARELGLPWIVVHLHVGVERTRRRMQQRGPGASDAGWDVYCYLRERFEPPSEIPAAHRMEWFGLGWLERGAGTLVDRWIELGG